MLIYRSIVEWSNFEEREWWYTWIRRIVGRKQHITILSRFRNNSVIPIAVQLNLLIIFTS